MALSDLATDDFQNRGDNYPKSGIPVYISVNKNIIDFLFKNTSESVAKKWCTNYLSSKNFKIISMTSGQDGDYHDDWVYVNATCEE